MECYTHIGGRGYTGHYAVTADAIRKPGKSHALVLVKDGGGAPYLSVYRSVCGETIHAQSDDHFVDANPITLAPDTAGTGVTCTRCRKILGTARWSVQVYSRSWGKWLPIKDQHAHPTKASALAVMDERRNANPIGQYRVRQV